MGLESEPTETKLGQFLEETFLHHQKIFIKLVLCVIEYRLLFKLKKKV